MELIVIFLVFVLVVMFFRKHKKHIHQKNKISPFLKKISEFNDNFKEFLSQKKYLSNFEICNFKEETESLYKTMESKEFKDSRNFKKEGDLIKSFLDTYKKLDSIIALRNEQFIEDEINDTNDLLSDIEGKSLDTQQRKAIIIDQDNHLVIAGAGSGKTTTIAGKVKYLTQRQSINPHSILLISFTNNSANEMRNRIFGQMKIDVPVKTFHSLGLEIISAAKNEKPSVFGDEKEKLRDILESFVEGLKKENQYLNRYIEFVVFYLKPYKNPFEFNSDGEHNNYLNEQKLEGLKMVENELNDGTIITYRERLKSQEEVSIANFLFINGIKYEYEQKFEHVTASMYFSQYKPDFYLPDYKIYIEHFGIDENGNVPHWFKSKAGKTAKQIYNEGIEWKRNIHNEKGTVLVETYSWQQRKGILLTELKKKLEERGVKFKPLSDEELLTYMSKNGKKEVDDFLQLIVTFLNLFKSNSENIKTIKNFALNKNDDRALRFLDLFEPIFEKYQQYLTEKEVVDFSDMINQSAEFVASRLYLSSFDYIIIDEYQDVSLARFKLVKALLDQKANTKLFCVGDDWQSIYRFAGSDIGLFTNFEEFYRKSKSSIFERVTHKSFIEHTYRFDNRLIDLSSGFIMKNKNQISKKLKSNIHSNDSPYTIFQYSDPERKGKNIDVTLKKVLSDIGNKNKDKAVVSVVLLGRYGHEKKSIEGVLSPNKKFDKDENPYDFLFPEYPNLKIRF